MIHYFIYFRKEEESDYILKEKNKDLSTMRFLSLLLSEGTSCTLQLHRMNSISRRPPQKTGVWTH